MLKDNEQVLRALASDEIATQMLTPEERKALARFIEELDRLGEERNIPLRERVDLVEEVFALVPGSREALDKQTEILDTIFKGGQG